MPQDKIASASRVMQFEGGPQRTRFYACDAHYDALHVPSMCHFPIFTEPVRNEDPADGIECDFCREGGYD